MPRALIASRVRVPLERQAEYRQTVTELAGSFRAAGSHLWLFRHRDDPELFLEFREGAADQISLLRDGGTAAERELDRRLKGMGVYVEGDVAWGEVALATENQG
jgi:hypothetical protein